MREPRPRRRGAQSRRTLAAIVASLVAHGLLTVWMVSRDHTPPPPPQKETVTIEVIDPPVEPEPEPAPAPEPEPEPAPEPPPQMRQSEPEPEPEIPDPEKALVKQREEDPTPQPLPTTNDPDPDRPQSAQTREDDSDAPPHHGAPTTGGGEANQALQGIDLFDSSALGMAVQRGKPSHSPGGAAVDPRTQSPDSAEAENVRVGERVAGFVDRAQRESASSVGLTSSCFDGVDNNMDAEMDCADPICRTLPICANTTEFVSRQRREIPDNDQLGIVSEIAVDQPGTVRGLSVKVNLRHGAPGDVAIILEHQPSGRRSTLRVADRGDATYNSSFFAPEFVGRVAAGRWRLRVADHVAGGAGRLDGWKLFLTRDPDGCDPETGGACG